MFVWEDTKWDSFLNELCGLVRELVCELFQSSRAALWMCLQEYFTTVKLKSSILVQLALLSLYTKVECSIMAHISAWEISSEVDNESNFLYMGKVSGRIVQFNMATFNQLNPGNLTKTQNKQLMCTGLLVLTQGRHSGFTVSSCSIELSVADRENKFAVSDQELD